MEAIAVLVQGELVVFWPVDNYIHLSTDIIFYSKK